jgi:hypothetical protein
MNDPQKKAHHCTNDNPQRRISNSVSHPPSFQHNWRHIWIFVKCYFAWECEGGLDALIRGHSDDQEACGRRLRMFLHSLQQGSWRKCKRRGSSLGPLWNVGNLNRFWTSKKRILPSIKKNLFQAEVETRHRKSILAAHVLEVASTHATPQANPEEWFGGSWTGDASHRTLFPGRRRK